MSDEPEEFGFEQCPLCDYDLRGRGEANRCSECGFTWDPRKATFAYRRDVGASDPGRWNRAGLLFLGWILLSLTLSGAIFGPRPAPRWPAVIVTATFVAVIMVVGLIRARRKGRYEGRLLGVLTVSPQGLRRIDRDGRSVSLAWSIFRSARVKRMRDDLYRLRLSWRPTWDWVSWIATAAGGPQYYFQTTPARAAAVQRAVNAAIAGASGSAPAPPDPANRSARPPPRGGAAAAGRMTDHAG